MVHFLNILQTVTCEKTNESPTCKNPINVSGANLKLTQMRKIAINFKMFPPLKFWPYQPNSFATTPQQEQEVPWGHIVRHLLGGT